MPSFAGQQQIEVKTPDGTEMIDNPLFTYKFPQSAVDGNFGEIVSGDRDKTKIVRCTPDEANARLAEIDFKGMVVSFHMPGVPPVETTRSFVLHGSNPRS